jgi:phosphoserine aminotransferase
MNGSSERVYNFSAGPCQLPLEVVEKCRDEMVNYRGAGMGIMEMSHRSKEFMAVSASAHNIVREVLSVPQNYKIILLQGGATGQFAAVPLNMLGSATGQSCDYVVTGQWGDKAAKECTKYASKVNRVCDTKSTKYTVIPSQSDWTLDSNAAYCHYTANETVNGVEFKYTPEVSVPLVADMSSNFLSKPIEVEKHAMIYAGAQKNAGPAGVTCVMVKEDLLGKEMPICPAVMSWKEFAAADSMYNTPPCYAIYVMATYMEYTKAKGGITYWDELSDKKSTMIYGTIKSSDGFYTCPIDPSCQSRMNVPFQIKGGDEALEKKFIEEARKMKLYNLAGHRSVGGIRASLYNGVPMEGIDALASFMKSFADENAK